MERTYSLQLEDKIGQEVLLKGWVHIIRHQSKIIFINQSRKPCVFKRGDECVPGVNLFTEEIGGMISHEIQKWIFNQTQNINTSSILS